MRGAQPNERLAQGPAEATCDVVGGARAAESGAGGRARGARVSYSASLLAVCGAESDRPQLKRRRIRHFDCCFLRLKIAKNLSAANANLVEQREQATHRGFQVVGLPFVAPPTHEPPLVPLDDPRDVILVDACPVRGSTKQLLVIVRQRAEDVLAIVN